MTMQRPGPDDTAPYYRPYIDRVPEGDVLATLRAQRDATQAFLARIGEGRAGHRYAVGKWSIKQVVGHMIDAERVFGHRGFQFARGDASPLPSMEQDAYMAGSDFDRRTLASLARELRAVREAQLAFWEHVTEEEGARSGMAAGCSFTVRSIPYILAGHELHHLAVLRERYVPDLR
jgi:hypothetical protein